MVTAAAAAVDVDIMVVLGGDAGGEAVAAADADGDEMAAATAAVLIVFESETFPVVSFVMFASSSGMGTISVSAVINSYLVTNFVNRRHRLVSLYTSRFYITIH